MPEKYFIIPFFFHIENEGLFIYNVAPTKGKYLGSKSSTHYENYMLDVSFPKEHVLTMFANTEFSLLCLYSKGT